MKSITLEPVPSQSVIVELESDRYEITLKSCGDFMIYGVKKNGVTIISTGARIINQQGFLTYKYMRAGDFFLSTQGEAEPNFNQFGKTQFLKYATKKEIEEFYG